MLHHSVLTACCFVRNLHSQRAHYELLKSWFIPTRRNNSWEGESGVLVAFFSFFFSCLRKMYLHKEGSSDVCALKNAVMFFFFFLNSIKTRNSTLDFF